MKYVIQILFVFVISNLYGQISFDDYFIKKSMRIDYAHSGNAIDEYYVLERVIQEPFWAGSVVNLFDIFDYGHHKIMVYDSISNKLIYSKGFSSLFNEWRNTDIAKRQCGNFFESIIIPFPKKTIHIEFLTRHKSDEWLSIKSFYINPHNDIDDNNNKYVYEPVKIKYSGEPSENLDILFIAEGYTNAEKEKFINDCKKLSSSLFSLDPFKKNQKKINIWAIHSISEESGVSNPLKADIKKTVLGASFNTLDSERYLWVQNHFKLRDIASNAPYDHIYVLANTNEYGGGGIYNFFSIGTASHDLSDFLFWHEFGHAFAGLADEYASEDEAFQNYYPPQIEPWEPNITNLVAFESKWQEKLKKNTGIPTDENAVKDDVIGVFEGAGYMEKGMYRPMKNCIMHSTQAKAYCVVCQSVIEKKINFYSK